MSRMILIPKHRKKSKFKGVHKRSHRKQNSDQACRIQPASQNTGLLSRSASASSIASDQSSSTDASLFGEA